MRPLREGLGRGLLVLLSAVWPLAASPEHRPPLEPLEAGYRLLRSGVELARVEVRLELDPDGAYRYHSHTTPVGLIALFREDEVSERSEGHWQDERFVPEEYRYSHRRDENTRRVEIDFHWPEGRAVNRAGGTTWTMSVPPGTQDKLGQQLSLMRALADGLRTVVMQVADGGTLKTYRYDVLGRERMRTPAGEFMTWRVKRRKDEHPSRLTLWSAPELDYLPVRMDRREDDDVYRMELVSLVRDPAPEPQR